MAARGSIVRMICVVLCCGLNSCDLFKTRTPEEPSQASSNYVPPTDAGQVLDNMVRAFQDGNSVNYAKSFSDSLFDFEAAVNARTRYGGVFGAWNKLTEQQYFEKAVSRLEKNSSVLLTFDPYSVIPTSDSSQVETNYHLVVPHTVTGLTKDFVGHVQFTFVRNQSGLWSISRWLDVDINASDSTWSDLKGIASAQW